MAVERGAAFRRRTDRAQSAQQFFDRLLSAALDWPGTVVRLQRDSLADYCNRATSGDVPVSELYHENSKLFAALIPELAASRVDAEMRAEFVRRRSAAGRTGAERHVELDGVGRELLRHLARGAAPALFYAVEVYLLCQRVLVFHDPVTDTCELVKNLSDHDRVTLERALGLFDSEAVSLSFSSLIFIVGSFARNDALLGPRGYRRTLVEAGRVAQQLADAAGRTGCDLRMLYEFADRDVDRVLEADGTEVGTLLVLSVGQV